MKFGLKQEHIESIKKVINQHSNAESIIIYGSRAKGNYRKGSDIDLTLKGNIGYSDLVKMEACIDDLLLPYKVDLSLYHEISNDELLDHINRVGKNSNNP